MSGKTKETPPSQLANRSLGAGPGQPAVPESAEMSGNERNIEIPGLTFRQRSVLPSVVLAPSIAGAARNSGVAESTLRRWLEEPAFREELERLRQEAYDLARKQLQAMMPRCLAIMAEVAAESPDPALRLRAARYLLSSSLKYHEIDGLRERVRDLQQVVEDTKNTSPL